MIIASNHLSFCDSFFMPVMVPRKVTFLAKAEYFTTPGIKGLFSRMFMSAVGQVPIDRSDADASRAALNTGVRVLNEGKVLGIYPEGTRSPDGRLYRGKTGVARMVLESGAVVVPCAMVNTAIIQPPGRDSQAAPAAGDALRQAPRLLPLRGDVRRPLRRRSMTDEIMYELMQLSGQEYVDTYAAKVKKAMGTDTGFGAREAAEVREIGDRVPDTRAG